jgi:RNA polymerase sigma-70 factor (ECF subfamily)
LLHDVFDFDHGEIAEIVGKSAAACRKLLERARKSIAAGRAMLRTSRPEHRRLLQAFVRAATAGEVGEMVNLLAEDAVIVTDGGPRGVRVGNVRNLSQPLEGAARVAAFVVAATRRGAAFQAEERQLNGQPAIVLLDGDRPFAAMLLAVAKGKVQRIFFHADPERLSHLGPPVAVSSAKPKTRRDRPARVR